jgi:alpha-ketoglutarate-dependent taurine dioxygenase
MDGTVYSSPGKATLLKYESPASKGGDTEFANLFAAYEALPEARKRGLACVLFIVSPPLAAKSTRTRRPMTLPAGTRSFRRRSIRWSGIKPMGAHRC